MKSTCYLPLNSAQNSSEIYIINILIIKQNCNRYIQSDIELIIIKNFMNLNINF